MMEFSIVFPRGDRLNLDVLASAWSGSARLALYLSLQDSLSSSFPPCFPSTLALPLRWYNL